MSLPPCRPATPVPETLEPVMLFREREGTTLIVLEDAGAAAGLDGVFRSRMITLNIHSSLEAVGFLAAITARLASRRHGRQSGLGFLSRPSVCPRRAGGGSDGFAAQTGCGQRWLSFDRIW